MALIQITDLTFTYPGSFDPVFEHVSFQLDTDWRLGLTGRNGRGKTTLLRLLQGQYPHQGTITAPGGFEYFPYPIPDAALTPLELLECSFPDVPQWRLRRELAPLFVTDDALYRPFSTLSGGEQAKILLALLFAREGRYLLIDEPTNHLDETGRALVSRYLAKKSGFLLVSHDRAFLDGCVDHILSINRGGIEVQKGNFSSWYENRQRQDAFELAQNAQLKKEIGRLKQAAPLKLHQLPYHTDRLALLRDVSVCYGGAPVCRGISFCVEQGDRIALRGANGTGKTSLLRLLCGEDVPHTGTVERSSRLRISYVRQDPSGLRGDLGAYAARYGLDESLFKAILRKLDFARVQFEKDMADFSAGQKKKVLLARSLCEPSHLLVWDEPLNYVDVLSRMQIEDLLLEFQPTIVFVEHDRVFCDHVATKAVML